MTDWTAVTTRNARSVQTTVGWIFWDPGAVARYRALGLPENLPDPLGYIAVHGVRRSQRWGPPPPPPRSVRSARSGIAAVFDPPLGARRFRQDVGRPRRGGGRGPACHAARIIEPLIEFGPELWSVVEALPLVGRVFFGAHLAVPRPSDPLLSGWHAVNCLREWRGDTHWALVVAASGPTHGEASILHNAWLGYEDDWLARSRGTSPADLEAGWRALEAKGLAAGRSVTSGRIAALASRSRTTPIG